MNVTAKIVLSLSALSVILTGCNQHHPKVWNGSGKMELYHDKEKIGQSMEEYLEETYELKRQGRLL